MKVLIVCNGNLGYPYPFIEDQVKALNEIGIETEYFLKLGNGIKGYLKNYIPLKKAIKNYKPDLIHAHYSLSGLLANMQRKTPVVTTYHGSDIHQPKNIKYSNLTYTLSRENIFVSGNLQKILGKNGGYVIPCGVDFDVFYEIPKAEAKQKLNLDKSKKYILFSSHFSNEIKDPQLAKDSIALLKDPSVELLELKGYSRKEVNLLFNASEIALLTSFKEGSPQFIKEAMATNTPIVSVDVGDVKSVVNNVDGCYVNNTREPEELKDLIIKALEFSEKNKKTDGRNAILDYDNKIISEKILNVYQKILS